MSSEGTGIEVIVTPPERGVTKAKRRACIDEVWTAQT